MSQKIQKEPISDAEFHRLWALYKQRNDPNRRAPPRVDRPIDIKPSVPGARIVNWEQYMEMVERGAAIFPPAKNK